MKIFQCLTMEGIYTVYCCLKLLIYRVQGYFVTCTNSSNEIFRRGGGGGGGGGEDEGGGGRRVYKQPQLHLNVIIVAIPEALNISTVRCMSL